MDKQLLAPQQKYTKQYIKMNFDDDDDDDDDDDIICYFKPGDDPATQCEIAVSGFTM